MYNEIFHSKQVKSEHSSCKITNLRWDLLETITMGFPSSTKIQYSHNLRYKREVVITITNNISFSLNCTMEAIYTLQYTTKTMSSHF